jgi:DNA uptake protein ComE-like DNA-binding protein
MLYGIGVSEFRTTCGRVLFVTLWLAALTLAMSPLGAREAWVELKNCRLDANEANDADSFHVTTGGKEYIFRLYFVDAAETDAGFPERVAEQAKYFGLTTQQTIQLGELARTFTKQKLAAPFTVRTCMQDALGRSKKPRYYAFIQTSEGEIGELLVANGLARVHGTAAPVGLTAPDRQKRKLQRLEREAKQQKVGAWGASVGRMTARLATQPAKTGASSFDAFFHPERVAAAAAIDPDAEPTPSTAATAPRALPPLMSASPVPSGAPLVKPSAPSAAAATETKLDPNTATAEQLMAIKGIGPVLAGRIIEARPYTSSNELQKAKGIGPKKYEVIRPFFIDPPAAPPTP